MKQVIAEQEKDLACLNEEKRYFQMKLMSYERRFEEEDDFFVDSEDFGEVPQQGQQKPATSDEICLSNGFPPCSPLLTNNTFTIPPTIPECDEC